MVEQARIWRWHKNTLPWINSCFIHYKTHDSSMLSAVQLLFNRRLTLKKKKKSCLRPCCDNSQVWHFYYLLRTYFQNITNKKVTSWRKRKKKPNPWRSLKYCQNPNNTLGKERCKTGLQLCLKEATATTNIVLIRRNKLRKQRLNHRASLLLLQSWSTI